MKTAIAWLGACLALTAIGCGGGEGAVFGIGNSGNDFAANELEAVAAALADADATPLVTDEMISEIFAAVLERAHRGNPEAALIVLRVAEEQRSGDDDDDDES